MKALEKGAAEIAVSKPLVEALLISSAKETALAQAQKEGSATDDATIQNLAAQQVAQQLQGLMATGFVKLDGDTYQSTAKFENGKLSVNGQDIPLTAGAADSATDEETPPEEPDAAEEPAPHQ